MKTIHLFVALPRSGSTVLASILNQNPSVHVSTNTAMLEVLQSVEKTWTNAPTIKGNPVQEQLTNITRAVVESMYQHRSEPIIIDRKREWGANIPFARKVLERDVKVISTVRDLPSAMASWVSLYKRNEANPNQGLIEQEINNMWNTLVKHNVNHIVQLKKDAGDNALFIQYDDLMQDPRYHLSQIENFLGLPTHQYDLDNIEGEYQDKNVVPWGLKGMNRIRPKLEKVSLPAEEELGPELYKKFLELDEKFKKDMSWK